MAELFTPVSVTNLSNSSLNAAINANFAAIATLFTDVLSRTDIAPNQMVSSLDMNSNRIINLPNPVNALEPLRLQDLSTFIGGGTIATFPAGGTTGQVLAKTSNADYAVAWTSESSELTAGTGITLTGSTPTTIAITNTAVTATSYGSSTSIPSFTVNPQGQLTAASGNAVIAPAGTLTGTTLASNVVTSSLTSVGAGALGTVVTKNTGTSGGTVPLLNTANTWSTTQTFTSAPVFTDASGSRTALGLGTAAVQNTGTSGANLPFLNGTNTWSGAHTFSPASGTALTIRPAAATAGLGIDIQQSGPVSSALTADFAFNKIQVTSDGTAVTAPGSYSYGLYVEYDLGGANARGGKYAGKFIAFNGTSGSMTTGGDIVGVSGIALGILPNGGTNTGAGAVGTLFGADIQGVAASGATNYFVVAGFEVGALVNTGASTKHRWAVSISGNGDLRGAGSDAAIHIGAPTSTGAYTNTLHWSDDNGFSPVHSGSTMFGNDGASHTLTHFTSLASYTFTGNLFDFGTPFKVTGAGVMTIPTINAFTLAGTVSGGGNQINNVIIGTTTPLAGLFTTLSASTSLTSSLLIGGTGTTGTQVTFKTTTGVGTTDGFLWTRGSNGATTAMTLNNTGLGIGTVAPDQLLTINGNTGASVASSFSTGLHIVGADGSFGGMTVDAYGTNGSLMGMRQAGGTLASKTATVAGQIVFSQVALGYDGTSAYGTLANIRYVALNQTSPTDHSGSIVLRTVASGSTTVTDTVTVASANTTINIGDLVPTAGNIVFGTATKTVVLKQGANGCVGTFVANGTTPVTISNTNVAITDCIIISLNTASGTVGTAPEVKTITAGVGFTTAGVALDTSTYNYCIIKNAA